MIESAPKTMSMILFPVTQNPFEINLLCIVALCQNKGQWGTQGPYSKSKKMSGKLL